MRSWMTMMRTSLIVSPALSRANDVDLGITYPHAAKKFEVVGLPGRC